jgi:hypothetical protein
MATANLTSKCRRCVCSSGPCQLVKVRARNRQKRCYELAGRGICEQDKAKWLLLCHGLVSRDGDFPYSHAWILDPETHCVYDPVLDRCFSEDEYREKMSARIERTYTYHQVCEITCATGHWGPWH